MTKNGKALKRHDKTRLFQTSSKFVANCISGKTYNLHNKFSPTLNMPWNKMVQKLQWRRKLSTTKLCWTSIVETEEVQWWFARF